MAFGDETGARLSARQGWLRVGIGLAQGLFLYALIKAHGHGGWLAQAPELSVGLFLALAFTPILVEVGLTETRPRTLAGFAIIAAIILGGLGAYAAYRDPQVMPQAMTHDGDFISLSGLIMPVLMLFSGAALFIAYKLVAPADQVRRLVAPYRDYFDSAWTNGLQLALVVLFVGLFWVILGLGVALFMVIHVDWPSKLVAHMWFSLPVTTTALAAAVHLTDIRPGLVRGARNLLLNLLSWLLPLLTLVAAGFLLTLPFTGLKALFATQHAASLLLCAEALLILLVNAVYQDGDEARSRGVILVWSVRITAIALLPLWIIGAYSLSLRVSEHGLTPSRVCAIACTGVAAVYVVGYLGSVFVRGRWMAGLERVNLVAGVVMILTIIALLSPLADPARLSVDEQIARLKAGQVKPEAFDYAFLRFRSGRYGPSALDKLANEPLPGVPIKALAEAARASDNPWRLAQAHSLTPQQVRAQIDVWPKGAVLPPDFPGDAIETGPIQAQQPCLTGASHRCDATLIDLDWDGKPEILIFEPHFARVYAKTQNQGWRQVGTYVQGGCPPLLDAVKAGQLHAVPAKFDDLEAGGHRYSIQVDFVPCGDEKQSAKLQAVRVDSTPHGSTFTATH
jgi:hypothetical protein